MMKKLFFYTFTCLSILSFFGCSDDDNLTYEADLVGDWNIVEIKEIIDSQDIDVESIIEASECYPNPQFTFQEDGNATMSYFTLNNSYGEIYCANNGDIEGNWVSHGNMNYTLNFEGKQLEFTAEYSNDNRTVILLNEKQSNDRVIKNYLTLSR